MRTVVTGQNIGKILTEALGLPKYTRSFVLRCEVDQVVTVECEYYPAIDPDSLELALAEFDLVRRDPPAPQAFDFDAWLKDRDEKAHADMMARHRYLARIDQMQPGCRRHSS